VFPEKKKKLEAEGWKVGSADELLQLTPEEVECIESKLALKKTLNNHRKRSYRVKPIPISPCRETAM
jgi:hypothetical protein